MVEPLVYLTEHHKRFIASQLRLRFWDGGRRVLEADERFVDTLFQAETSYLPLEFLGLEISTFRVDASTD
jgi:hypothetical protein